MKKFDIKSGANFLKALGHPTRLAIVENLSRGKKCVKNLEELVKSRQANISQHLALLRMQGIVDYCQEGKLRCYFLKEPEKPDEIGEGIQAGYR